MRILIAVVLLGLASVAAGTPRPEDHSVGVQRPWGTWKLIRVRTWDGDGIETIREENSKSRFTFRKDDLSWWDRKPDGTKDVATMEVFRLELRPPTASTYGEIDMRSFRRRRRNSSHHGLYEVRGHLLRLCFDRQYRSVRPKDFAPNADHMIMELEQIHPGEPVFSR